MTAPQLGRLVVGSISQAVLDSLGPASPAGVPRILAAGATMSDVFSRVLSQVIEQLPEQVRQAAPLILASSDYFAVTAARYVVQCGEAQAGGRRLRPSEPIEPEPGQMIQEFMAHGSWTGPSYALVGPRHATQQALRWAHGAVSAGRHRAMIVCEISLDRQHNAFLIAAVPMIAAGSDAFTTGGLPDLSADAPWIPDVGDAALADGSLLVRVARSADRRPAARPVVVARAPVVLSGLGLITGFGVGVAPFWSRLVAGDRALTALTRFDASQFRSKIVCQVDVGVPPGPVRRRRITDLVVREALRDAGLERLPPRTLLVFLGVLPHMGEASRDPFVQEVALEPDWDGDGLVAPGNAAVTAHACASGAFAMAMAKEWLLSGLVDVAMVLGVCLLNIYDYSCLDVLRGLSAQGARPLDSGRTGITIGEGAGAIVMETAEHAAARGHAPLAALGGLACRIGAPATAEMNVAIRVESMRAALAEAGLTCVDYVHAHAGGARQGDEAELLALETLGNQLGWAGVPISSHKGAIGHTLYASVFPAVAASVQAMRHGLLPGTPGLRDPLPSQHVRVLRTAERCDRVHSVMIDSFGFAGNSAALVLTAVPGTTR